MVLQLPENLQLLLGSSADSVAELPQQAFALTLSDDVIEDMIESVRNGQEIQLSLGDTPVSLTFMLPFFFALLLGGAVEVK
jgi:RNA polymerase II elongation factor ELL